MSDPVQVGDRVAWLEKGKARAGVVKSLNVLGQYGYVMPDGGSLAFVNGDKLTRVEPPEREQVQP